MVEVEAEFTVLGAVVVSVLNSAKGSGSSVGVSGLASGKCSSLAYDVWDTEAEVEAGGGGETSGLMAMVAAWAAWACRSPSKKLLVGAVAEDWILVEEREGGSGSGSGSGGGGGGFDDVEGISAGVAVEVS